MGAEYLKTPVKHEVAELEVVKPELYEKLLSTGSIVDRAIVTTIPDNIVLSVD